ncbi:hypothetical protein BGX38DRAFT_1334615 [Terfezia claveryi]|nr:hypothetical protein BGX38DRAFT_1334615 [Terfezia claveryi]
MAILGGKKPVDLTADFLRSLYEYTLKCIWKRLLVSGTVGGRRSGDKVLSDSAGGVWDDKAKDVTKQAALAAGIPEEHIYMISEPEAAAVHFLTELNHIGGNLDLANCGLCGGTVDLISYEVTSTAPLRVKECTIGTGDLCGSIFINRRFEDLVIHRIGLQAHDNMEDHHHYAMRKDFDEHIRPKFLPDDGGVICALPGVPDDPEKRVREMKISFSMDEIKAIFEPTFTDITALVQKQVDKAQAAVKRNVDGIILVEGFGSSKYLKNWL